METTQTAADIALLPLIVRDDRACRGDGEPVVVHNPWDDSPVARVPHMRADELREALDWAAERVSACASWPLHERMATLTAWAESIATHKEEIARLETREMGKPIRQTRRIIDGIVARIGLLCETARNMRGEQLATRAAPATRRVHACTLREPFGLTAGILPFNSPVSALVWKVAPALLMGNATVIKVSEQAPVAALRTGHLLAELSLPEGALQVVNGDGAALGPVLSQHPGIRKISLTGSTPVGIDLLRRGADTFKRITLECGSNDPAIVLDDADLPAVARIIADLGMRLYNGQICVAPRRCIIAQSVCDRFEKLLVEEASRIVTGDPLDERTELGPLVSAAAAERVEQQINQSIAAGARLACGGRRRGAFIAPTVLSGVGRTNPVFAEGAFGPVVRLIRAADDEEAIALANDSPYALRSAVFGRDIQRAAAIARRLDCGGVAINSPTLVDNPRIGVTPRKMSGLGAEGIRDSLLEYSQEKFIWIHDFWPET
jgi:lactaldehyde dehydrogenase